MVDIINYPEFSLYHDGGIYDKLQQTFLRTSITRGYVIVYLKTDVYVKRFSLHKLLAQHFIPNPDPEKYTAVVHVDGNKLNNDLSNLKWVKSNDFYKDFSVHETKDENTKVDLELGDCVTHEKYGRLRCLGICNEVILGKLQEVYRLQLPDGGLLYISPFSNKII
jgi:hypothetical protein